MISPAKFLLELSHHEHYSELSSRYEYKRSNDHASLHKPIVWMCRYSTPYFKWTLSKNTNIPSPYPAYFCQRLNDLPDNVFIFAVVKMTYMNSSKSSFY